jgi:D-alanyl-D-alanine dipeptidase
VKAIVIALVVIAFVLPVRAQTLPGGFVFLRDIDPTIIQDIRYAGSNNFVGRPLTGYEAAECVVKRRETPAGRRYNPAFSKKNLFRLGYIAEHSGHSTGAAVDLTLVDLNDDNSPQFDPNKAYADCTAPASARAPEASVDMGTGYDCADVKAHAAARSITSEQRRWRNVLVAAMAKQGFVNYSKEWWHFSLPGAGGPAYDFPVTARMR